jgi:dipeptidyl aminopeptidase/acylaminoacyl peptidase
MNKQWQGGILKNCTRWICSAAAMLLMAASSRSAPPAPEVFFGDQDIGEAVLSPSGKRLAFTTGKGMDRVGLVVLDLAPGGKITRPAQVAREDVADIHWVNDDRLLYSLVDLSGERSRAPGLFAVDVEGGGRRVLIERSNRIGFNTGTPDYTVLDRSHWLRFVPEPRQGQTNEQVLVSSYGYQHDTQTLVWLNTRTGMTRQVTTQAPGNNTQWLVDDRGEPRATLTFKDDRVRAYWLKPGGSEWEQLFDTTVLKQPFELHSVDNQGRLYVTHVPKGSAYAVLARYDAETKAPAAKALVSVPGFDFSGYLIQQDDAVLGVRAMADSETTVWLDGRMAQFQQEVDKRLPGLVNRVDCRRCGQPDMVALVDSSNDHDPGKLWIYQAQPPAGQPRWMPIGRVREAVVPAQMAGVDFQTISSRDGRKLPVWVTRPDGAKGPLPAVVLVHGGPWLRGTSWQWDRWGQFLASRGYLVIQPEFRGSTGYGIDHFRAGFKQWGQSMQDDVADALRWAQQQGLASDKACIIGGSYGGYSTLMGLAKDPDLYRCGVAWMAVTDLELFAQGAWWLEDDGELSRRLTVPEMVGDPKQDAAMLAANSPVKLASRIKAPLLLAHGELDYRVPIAHGRRMKDALKAAGNPPEWVSYPEEGHGFYKREDRLDFARRVEAFLAKHLQP